MKYTGDIKGWQVALCCEVILRHGEEREQLLQYLQDESLEDLTEAASLMSEQEQKARLAELHTKRRGLNLDLIGTLFVLFVYFVITNNMLYSLKILHSGWSKMILFFRS